MLNVIPVFISDRVREEVYSGSFKGSTLHVDISGFTTITEKLMSRGKEGAETVSSLLNTLFNPAIKCIHGSGGFISTFGGDSFTVIIPGGEEKHARSLAVEIDRIVRSRSAKHGKVGLPAVSATFSTGSGSINWGIPRWEKGRMFYFSGKPVTESNSFQPEQQFSRRLESKTSSSNTRVAPTVARLFVPAEILEAHYGGEFREVAPVFIRFQDTGNSIDDLSEQIIRSAADYGGYVSGLFFEQTGPMFLVLFGAPTAFEGSCTRAASFILALRNRTATAFSTGVSRGPAYTGFVGNRSRCTYTALGDTVNTAARLAVLSRPGEITGTEEFFSAAGGSFKTSKSEIVMLKGKSEPVAVKRLDGHGQVTGFLSHEEQMHGRESELKDLLSQMESLNSKSGFQGITYVYGDPGSGKSLLVAKALEKLSGAVQVIRMETDDVLRKSLNPFSYALRYFSGLPSSVLSSESRGIFRSGFSAVTEELKKSSSEEAEGIVSELERTSSLLEGLLGLNTPGSLYESLPPRARFENTLTSLKELFKGLSLLKPVILVVEDIQWLDTDSHRTFLELCRNISSFPILIVSTSRYNDDGSKPVISVDAEIPIRSIELGCLKKQYACDLAEDVLGSTVSEKLGRMILDRCSCNPFYIRQFCLYLLENRFTAVSRGIITLSDTPEEIPSSIMAILVARLDRLTGKLRTLVQTASVLGREFNALVLSGMLKGGDVLHRLDEPELSTIWAPLTEILYLFRHDLMRDAAYGMLLKKKLKTLHRNAAEAIVLLFHNEEEMLSDIAYHFLQAGDRKMASRYLEKAGEFAAGSYRNQEALEHYRNLADLLEKGSEKYTAILMKIEEILRRTGELSQSEELLKEIILESSKEGYLDHELTASIISAGVTARHGNVEEACSFLEKTAARALDANKKDLASDAKHRLASMLVDRAEHDSAEKLFEEALVLADEVNDRAGEGEILGAMARSYIYRGMYIEAMETLEKSADIVESVNRGFGAVSARYNLGVVNYLMGNRKKGFQAFSQTLKISRERGDKRSIGLAIGSIGSYHADLGDHDRAMAAQQEKLTMAKELNDKPMMLYALGNLGISCNYKGLYNEAIEYFDQYSEIALQLDAKSELCMAKGHQGLSYSRLWNYEKAEECFKEEYELACEINEAVNTINALRNRSTMEKERGKFSESLETLEKALAMALEIGSEIEESSTLGALADLHLFLGNLADAEKQAGRGLEIADKSQDAPSQAYMLARQALVSLERNNRKQAEELALRCREKALESVNSTALWQATTVLVRLCLPHEQKKASEHLKTIEEFAVDPDREAEYLTLRWKAGEGEKHREKAVEIYKDLIQRTGSATLTRKLADLES